MKSKHEEEEAKMKLQIGELTEHIHQVKLTVQERDSGLADLTVQNDALQLSEAKLTQKNEQVYIYIYDPAHTLHPSSG